MQICFTKAHNGLEFYIEHTLIIGVDRRPENPLETILLTSVFAANGQVVHYVQETVEQCATIINCAWKGTAPPWLS
jgi:hypothetical protein